jgi:hypothetical protein
MSRGFESHTLRSYLALPEGRESDGLLVRSRAPCPRPSARNRYPDSHNRVDVVFEQIGIIIECYRYGGEAEHASHGLHLCDSADREARSSVTQTGRCYQRNACPFTAGGEIAVVVMPSSLVNAALGIEDESIVVLAFAAFQ